MNYLGLIIHLEWHMQRRPGSERFDRLHPPHDERHDQHPRGHDGVTGGHNLADALASGIPIQITRGVKCIFMLSSKIFFSTLICSTFLRSHPSARPPQ